MSGQTISVRDLCLIATGAALLAVCSWLSIPFTVPFTLQSFAVCLLASLLGMRRGVLAVLVYMLLGAGLEYPLHHPRYDVPESMLPLSAAWEAYLALTLPV